MLKIYVTNLESVAVLHLHGRIVNGETEILRYALDSLAEARAVNLDFARVTSVDAHGLGVLLGLRDWTNARGIRFELMNVNKLVSHVLEITRLDTVFQITSAVEFFPSGSRKQQASVAA